MHVKFLTGLAAALSVTSVNAIATITTKGSKFFTSDGNQWFVKGVAYQLLPADPLLDTAQCTLDAALMKQLGANAIRVYHVTSGDHSGCMSAFEAQGIYLFVDLDTFTSAITQTAPMWTQAQESAFEAVMDEFQAYDNTAGFFIGNEVLNDGTMSDVSPFISAAVRDLKAYRSAKGYRNIPIGYSHADIASLRPNFQDYLVCGNSSSNIDFFGLNAYEWCGDQTYMTSGYEALTDQIMNYPVPIFFSETGCNTSPPRTFEDQTAIFGPQMSPYWSGAIIYEWIQEDNHYGLITYGGGNQEASVSAAPAGGFSRSGTPTPITPDFANLQSVWATVSPSSVAEAAYAAAVTTPACPAYTSGVWAVAGSVVLPTLGESLSAAAASSIMGGNVVVAAATATSGGASKAASTTTTLSGTSASAAATHASSTSSHTSATAAAATTTAHSGTDGTGTAGGAGLLGVMAGLAWMVVE